MGGLKTPAGRDAADAIDQGPFRHGGPKPQSREAAVLMLADGVEASVRSLSSRDEATIRGMVSQIIAERLFRRATPGDVPPADRLSCQPGGGDRVAAQTGPAQIGRAGRWRTGRTG
jgi:hypothetical protein